MSLHNHNNQNNEQIQIDPETTFSIYGNNNSMSHSISMPWFDGFQSVNVNDISPFEGTNKTMSRPMSSASLMSTTQNTMMNTSRSTTSLNHAKSVASFMHTKQQLMETGPGSSHISRKILMKECDTIRHRLGQSNIMVSAKHLEHALVTPGGVQFDKDIVNTDYPRPMSGLSSHPFPEKKTKKVKSKKSGIKKKKSTTAGDSKINGNTSTTNRISNKLGSIKKLKSGGTKNANKKNWYFIPLDMTAEIKYPIPIKAMTEERKNEAFQNDWLKISLSDIIRNFEARESLRAVYIQFYPFLLQMFRSYALEIDGHFFVGGLQFIQFAKASRIVDEKLTVKMMDDIFAKTNLNSDEKSSSDISSQSSNVAIATDAFNPLNMLTFPEFLESLARLAVCKFTSREKYKDIKAPEHLYALITQFIIPNSVESTDIEDVSQKLLLPAVSTWFKYHGKELYRMFMRYAALDETDKTDTRHEGIQPEETTLTVKEFSVMLKDKKLLGPKLSSRVAMTIFLHSQDDNDVSGALETTYFEFYEVILRLALAIYPDEDTDIDSKLDLLGLDLFTGEDAVNY